MNSVITRVDTFTLRRVRDVLSQDPSAVDVDTLEINPGKSLRWYLRGVADRRVVTLNGRMLSESHLSRIRPRAGDEVVVAELPGAVFTGGSLIALIGNLLIVAAVNVAVSYAIAALTPAPSRRRPRPLGDKGREEDSPTLSFFGQHNTLGAGRPVSLVYGRVRFGGHIIESFQRPRFDVVDDSVATVATISTEGSGEQDAIRLHTRIGLCHGPIDSVESIEIDDNPIENVRGVQYETVLGTNYQQPLEGFSETVNARSIQQLVTVAGGPVVVQTTGDVDTVEVGLLFASGLYAIDDEANLEQASVSVLFEYKLSTSGVYIPLPTQTISAAIRAPRPFWIRFPRLTRGTYDIRVTRQTADSAGGPTDPVDEFHFETFNEVSKGIRTHPGLAQIGIRHIPGEQSRLPQRYTSIVRGFNDIRVYSDASTFSKNWSENPAWCCAHWITHPLYGLGRFFDYDDIDIPSFLEWAQYCDELVSLPDGSLEARATFNAAIDVETNGPDMLQLFVQGSGVSLIQAGGRFRAVIDRADPMVQVFNEANIVAGSLTYTIVPRSERATRFTAEYVDQDNDWNRELAVLEDDVLASTNGQIDQSVVMFGVTRLSQVLRQLKRLLNQNRLSTVQVEFEAGLESLCLTVGSVFGLAHPSVGSAVAVGRVVSVTSQTQFDVDETLNLNPATTYYVHVVHQTDGAYSSQLVTGVTSAATNTISVASSRWERAIQAGDQYSIVSTALEKFRCTSITLAEDLKRKVSGVLYDETVYTDVIDVLPTDVEAAVVPSRRFPGIVTNLTATERRPENSAGDTLRWIDVAWVPPSSGFIDHYEIWWRESTFVDWRRAGESRGRQFTIFDSVKPSTTYNVAVVTVSPSGTSQAIDDAATTNVTTTA